MRKYLLIHNEYAKLLITLISAEITRRSPWPTEGSDQKQ